MLGNKSTSPRWSIAFKYESESIITKLKSISFQVGRTGAITPVANFEPVNLSGTIVKRASLYNANEIKKLDLHSNDMVIVKKGGEIIPKIIGVDKSKREKTAERLCYITHCPDCGRLLEKLEAEAIHYCPNYDCPTQTRMRLQHFVHKKAMNIDSLGERIIEQLYEHNLVNDFSDLYTLDPKKLIAIERFGEKLSNNILLSIEESKKISFHKVLFALGIRHIGENVATLLANKFLSIDAIMNASKEELLAIDQIGDIIAESLITYFSDEDRIEEINKLRKLGLQFSSSIKKEDNLPLKGLIFVVTGTFSRSREYLKDDIAKQGGVVNNSLSNKTDYLVVGDSPGNAKMKKTKTLNIRCISEKQIMSMIQNKDI